MKISIALCTYNGSKYLTDQLESLKNQTVKVDEIIACDDCSTDNTIEILKKYKDILNIKIFMNELKLGVTKNFEKAISLCSGDIIFLCDQDDIWEANKIEKMSTAFNDEKLGIVSCNGKIIDRNSKTIKKYTLWSAFGVDKINKETFSADFLIRKYIFTGMAMALRAELKKYILPISKNSIHDEWIGIIGTYFSKVYFMQDCLVKYRTHKSQKIGVYATYSIIDKYKRLKMYKFSDINQELNRVKDLLNRFTKLNADDKFLAKLKEKQKFFEYRTTKSKFRFFILLWLFLIGKYHLYTNGNYRTFIRDVFTS